MLLPATGQRAAAAAAAATTAVPVAAGADNEADLVDVAIILATALDAPAGGVPSADTADAWVRAGVSFAGAASASLQVCVNEPPVVATEELTVVAPWSPPPLPRRRAPSSAPLDALAVGTVAAAQAEDVDIDGAPDLPPPHPPVGDGEGRRAVAASAASRPLRMPGSPCSGGAASTSPGSSLASSSSASLPADGGGCRRGATAAVAVWMALRKEPSAAGAATADDLLADGGTAVPGAVPASDVESDADTVASVASDHLCALLPPTTSADAVKAPAVLANVTATPFPAAAVPQTVATAAEAAVVVSLFVSAAAVAAAAATTTASPSRVAAPQPTVIVDLTTDGHDTSLQFASQSLAAVRRRSLPRGPNICRAAAVLRALAGRVPWHSSPPRAAAAVMVAAAVDATHSLAALAVVLVWGVVAAVLRALDFGGVEGGGLQNVGSRNIRG
eukprot:TRINITY_DN2867_c0_g1_i1.p1 TRINITY_DN2867_c0_g1~~TRINITY_DN2867_c0_g1_i1.p1  ORF type:complete len:446 (-),score=119.82 TRINITY_DN2867_c0_g1_i1:326-1663(-)